MRMVDIIEKKRDGKELTTQEISFFIEGYTKGDIPDYQASALAMAIYFQDMNDRERADLTRATLHRRRRRHYDARTRSACCFTRHTGC